MRSARRGAIPRAALLAKREPLVDLGDRKLDLLLPYRMFGSFGLALKVRLRQSKRFELAHLFGIDLRAATAAPAALGFAFFDLFLDARFCVDEAFSGITHK